MTTDDDAPAKLCARCGVLPAIQRRPGPARCTECAGKPSLRQRRPRRGARSARTIGPAELGRQVLMHAAVEPPAAPVQRPATRGECAGGERPCPWVGCKHHLYLDINPDTGSIKMNFPDLEPWELKNTCSLDVAELCGITLDEVGEILNLTRERIRQVEVRALLTLKTSPEDLGADAEVGEVLP